MGWVFGTTPPSSAFVAPAPLAPRDTHAHAHAHPHTAAPSATAIAATAAATAATAKAIPVHAAAERAHPHPISGSPSARMSASVGSHHGAGGHAIVGSVGSHGSVSGTSVCLSVCLFCLSVCLSFVLCCVWLTLLYYLSSCMWTLSHQVAEIFRHPSPPPLVCIHSLCLTACLSYISMSVCIASPGKEFPFLSIRPISCCWNTDSCSRNITGSSRAVSKVRTHLHTTWGLVCICLELTVVSVCLVHRAHTPGSRQVRGDEHTVPILVALLREHFNRRLYAAFKVRQSTKSYLRGVNWLWSLGSCIGGR